MVHHHITGLPVLDDQQRVVGVVSDYDLLSLDAVSGKMQVSAMRMGALLQLPGMRPRRAVRPALVYRRMDGVRVYHGACKQACEAAGGCLMVCPALA
jgi:CBS-domain-containing membrane protein